MLRVEVLVWWRDCWLKSCLSTANKSVDVGVFRTCVLQSVPGFFACTTTTRTEVKPWPSSRCNNCSFHIVFPWCIEKACVCTKITANTVCRKATTPAGHSSHSSPFLSWCFNRKQRNILFNNFENIVHHRKTHTHTSHTTPHHSARLTKHVTHTATSTQRANLAPRKNHAQTHTNTYTLVRNARNTHKCLNNKKQRLPN